MKLDLFDSYNIRARLCPSIILLSPILLTLFLCFDDISSSITSSAVIIGVLLAFTNFVPVFQRSTHHQKESSFDYAANMLMPSDTTIDRVSKERYYTVLAKAGFECFVHPDNSEDFKTGCHSAITYIRNSTRDNRLLLEENINLGFLKNLYYCKKLGIIICLLSGIFTVIYSLVTNNNISTIPHTAYIALTLDVLILIIWVGLVRKPYLEAIAKEYAKTLIQSIDTIKQ